MARIIHALSSIDHSYYILHQKLTWNPSKQLPPILLIRQRIQRFTQFYQNFGIMKDSIFNYDQLGFSTKLPLILELGCVPNKTLEKETNLLFKVNSNNHTQEILVQKSYQSHVCKNPYSTLVVPYLGFAFPSSFSSPSSSSPSCILLVWRPK